jgi:hypothetical protein
MENPGGIFAFAGRPAQSIANVAYITAAYSIAATRIRCFS